VLSAGSLLTIGSPRLTTSGTVLAFFGFASDFGGLLFFEASTGVSCSGVGSDASGRMKQSHKPQWGFFVSFVFSTPSSEPFRAVGATAIFHAEGTYDENLDGVQRFTGVPNFNFGFNISMNSDIGLKLKNKKPPKSEAKPKKAKTVPVVKREPIVKSEPADSTLISDLLSRKRSFSDHNREFDQEIEEATSRDFHRKCLQHEKWLWRLQLGRVRWRMY
jgi:hypothetical protein